MRKKFSENNSCEERLSSINNMDEVFCPCTHEELKAFLMAVYPPQLRITGLQAYFMKKCIEMDLMSQFFI